MKNAYGNSGVDVNAGYELVDRIKKHVKKTQRPEVLGGLGGFGGLFDLSKQGVKEPVLVSGTDGVGTKILIAQHMDVHDTIGVDCVAMCVNDIIAQGAEPLFFLDYLACGKNQPEKLEKVVAGVAVGCLEAGCALIGGETAEMPDLYSENEYDLAGFSVGIAEKSHLVQKEQVKAGDVLIGLPASGIHSNGFSLVRKIFFKENQFSYDAVLPEMPTKTLGEELLTPTKIYVKALKDLFAENLLHGVAHITGGGFVENIPRMLPVNLSAKIQLGSWPVLPIFSAMEKYGKLNPLEMYEIFNMGIGMVLAVAPEKVARVQELLAAKNEKSFVMGEVVAGEEKRVLFSEVSA